MKKIEIETMVGSVGATGVEVPQIAFTHGGTFHADDVFSGALLRILNPNIEIIRGFEVPKNFEGLVFDIGRGRFDHHQPETEVRENGIKYAAFGLLWREFGLLLVEGNLDAWTTFEEMVVQAIDNTDNTGEYNPLSYLIKNLNPAWDSDSTGNKEYETAVSVAKTLLEGKLNSLRSVMRAETAVEEAIENCKSSSLLVLPNFCPWQKLVVGETDFKFVVYPSNRGGYCLQGIPQEKGTKETIVPFPKAWRGLSDDALVKVSGIEGMTFCHAGGFLVACDTLDTAKTVYKAVCNMDPEELV